MNAISSKMLSLMAITLAVNRVLEAVKMRSVSLCSSSNQRNLSMAVGLRADSLSRSMRTTDKGADGLAFVDHVFNTFIA